jgi:hypothetical protein
MTTQVALAALTVLSTFLVAVLKYSMPPVASLAAVNPLRALLAYVLVVLLCLLPFGFLVLVLKGG